MTSPVLLSILVPWIHGLIAVLDGFLVVAVPLVLISLLPWCLVFKSHLGPNFIWLTELL